MARIPPVRCGCTDRGYRTAWDDSNDDVYPRHTSSDAYPHTYRNTAHDHDDVVAEWKRVCILYRLHYREQRRGLLARHVEDCIGRASVRTDDGDVLWYRVNRRFRHAYHGPNHRVHRPGPRQRW